MKIYLASNYHSHPEMRQVRSMLEVHGHEVTSRWINGGHEMGQTPLDTIYAMEDIEDINNAEAMIFFSREQTPRQRGGRHVEFGYALALEMSIFVIGKKENVFHYLPKLKHFENIDEVIREINKR